MPEDYRQLVTDKANQYGINPQIALAQIQQESGFNPRAVSSAGAKGIAQFIPATAARFGLSDPFDPVASMDAWGQYMSSLLSRFNGRYDLALAGYNSGENRSEYAAAASEGRAINWSVLPSGVQSQTRPYVQAILAQAGFAEGATPSVDQITIDSSSDQTSSLPLLLFLGLGLVVVVLVLKD